MGIQMTRDGGEELAQYLSRYRSVSERRPVKKAMEYAGDLIAESAKRKVKKDSGELEGQIGYNTTQGAKTIAVTIATREARYAGPLEKGHKPSGWNKSEEDVLPQPFMLPAFDENRETAYNMIKDAVKSVVDKNK